MLFPKPSRRKKRPGPTWRGVPVSMSLLRQYVFQRDQVCVAWSFDRQHECRDAWSTPHAPNAWDRMTLAHVPEEGQNAYGRKPPDDEFHTVLECYGANVFPGPSAELRRFEREWISKREER